MSFRITELIKELCRQGHDLTNKDQIKWYKTPNVVLGDFTIVGAGSVVTKSFESGYCVIGGNPAKLLKTLEPQLCQRHKSTFEYNGYIPSIKFEEFRKNNLNV